MEGIELIDKILKDKVVLGEKKDINEELSLMPVYKIKINTLNVNTEIKNQNGDGSIGGISIIPISILKIQDNNISVIGIEPKNNHDVLDILPNILNNLDINEIIKSIRI